MLASAFHGDSRLIISKKCVALNPAQKPLYLVGTVLNANTTFCRTVDSRGGETTAIFVLALFEALVRFLSFIIRSKIITNTIEYSERHYARAIENTANQNAGKPLYI